MNEKSNQTDHRSEEQQERKFDLLIQRATTGLSDAEQHELDQLAGSSDIWKEIDRFEITAAAFDLALVPSEQEIIPSDVHDRLLISAGKFLGDRTSPPPAADLSGSAPDSKFELSNRRSTAASFRWREIASIAVTAACLLLMLSGFNPFAKTSNAPVANVMERMDEFISSRPTDLLELQWEPMSDSNAGGKVLWSDARQEGYMVFSDLDPNDPSLEQYQLWIFDNDANQKTPTDGGVFDISKSELGPDGTVVIPIKATVPVNRAVQFAVTVETPGGVYVSERKNIPVLAKIDDPD